VEIGSLLIRLRRATIPSFHVRGRNSGLEKIPLFFPPRRDRNSETFNCKLWTYADALYCGLKALRRDASIIAS